MESQQIQISSCMESSELSTPYELGDGNTTTTYEQCINFYLLLASRFPAILKFTTIEDADGGQKLYLGVVSSNGVFDKDEIKASGRAVFFNDNGIHPGEPEGIDVCMAIVRDFCMKPSALESLNDVIFLFIPVYNVDGCINRNSSSRANQIGPESFGFRGNSRNLDQNRDFVKCDSLTSQAFNRMVSYWDPDVMVDTHTSNGADYQYTMTLIHTQPNKLGGSLGPFLKDIMLPHIYNTMEQRGWPTCPYVNTLKEVPEDGIEDFIESPRYSTGYTSLHSILGFMPETHMLKSYSARYDSMRCIVDVILQFTVANAVAIQELRKHDRASTCIEGGRWPLSWHHDYERPSKFLFRGYKSMYKPSVLGTYSRLYYDQSQPWEDFIPYFDNCIPCVCVDKVPAAYYIPQAYSEVIRRLEWNGIRCHRLLEDKLMEIQCYSIQNGLESVVGPYEGHMFHSKVEVTQSSQHAVLRTGDYIVIISEQLNPRYVVETLEPVASDSFFRWGFFNAILEKKEGFSAYVFEDEAEKLLLSEPELRSSFDAWKIENPHLLSSQESVLQFIYLNCSKYREPEFRRYPVFSLTSLGELPQMS